MIVLTLRIGRTPHTCCMVCVIGHEAHRFAASEAGKVSVCLQNFKALGGQMPKYPSKKISAKLGGGPRSVTVSRHTVPRPWDGTSQAPTISLPAQVPQQTHTPTQQQVSSVAYQPSIGLSATATQRSSSSVCSLLTSA